MVAVPHFANNASSRAATPIAAADTSVQVLPGEGAKFPLITSPDFFMVTFEDRRTGQIEICKCTARSGDLLTVERAQEDTVAQDFYQYSTVSNRLTAGMMNILVGSASIPEAPADSKIYGRKDNSWAETRTKPQIDAVDANLQTQITQLGVDKEDKANKGVANGYTPLDATTKVPAAYLPAYVDDVQEFPDLASFPDPGSTGVLYVALDNNKTYRWSGSTYIEISPSPGSTDEVPEGVVNLYFTAMRASDAAPVQSVAGKMGIVLLDKADVGLENVDNTSDMAKPISTATQTALNTKLSDAPTSGGQYVRQSGTWALVSVPPANSTSDAPPASPQPGQIWWESDSGALYIWYDDGSSQQWVQVNILATGSGGFISGSGVPPPGVGNNGDYYINIANGVLYGPKTAGVWAVAIPLVPEAPSDGTQYVRKNAAWASVVVPPGTIISDTPPPAPAAGQHWWESDTGNFFIWYVDADGGQWVQINNPGASAGIADVPSDGVYYVRRNQAWAAGVEEAPNDGNEYVRVNGVWRLNKSLFYPVGVSSLTVTVPANAKMARIVGKVYSTTTAAWAPFIRVSVDGSTFLAGAADYSVAGSNFYGGSAASPSKQAQANTTAITLSPSSDRTDTPSMFQCDLIVAKASASQIFGFTNRGWSYNGSTTLFIQEYLWSGYMGGTAAIAATQILAFQISNMTFAAGSLITVEWVY